MLSGHGSSSGPSWGSPATIDEVYLRNPMEPVDVLRDKDFVESPSRRPNVVKTKRQFNYIPLNEEPFESCDRPSHTAPAGRINSPCAAATREEPLLIDLSFDATPQADCLYDTAAAFQSDQSRLYENYPSSAAVPDDVNSTTAAHYYSEVPIEPCLATPPGCRLGSPIKPYAVINEDMRKKRDEAFNWLDQALGNMTLGKSSPGATKTPSSAHGFDDDFSLDDASKSATAYAQLPEPSPCQPHYPKPGSWGDGSPAAAYNTTRWEQLIASKTAPGSSCTSAAVQTAHVRPFVVSSPSTEERPSLAGQVRLAAPWATDQDVKQALVLQNGNLIEAVRFLQVEKLYR